MAPPARPAPGRDALRTTLRLIVGIAVSFGCLYFATRGTDWSRVAGTLTGARPFWVFMVMLTSMATVYVRAQRWRILLRPLGDVPLYPSLSATAIGFGASAVLPFRLGELIRPALLGRAVGCGMSAALSSVVIERLFDMLLVISCLVGVAVAYPVPPALRRGAAGLGALAVLGFVVLLVMQRNRAVTERLTTGLLGRLPGRIGVTLLPMVRSFLSGLEGLADLPTVASVLGYSIYLWTVITLSFAVGFLALDIDVPLVAASLTTVVVVAAFVFLPQGPGFVGTWQAGCIVALGFFGVPKDVALGYSLLTWIVSMATNVSLAGIFLAREDVSLAQLLRTAEEPAAEVEG